MDFLAKQGESATWVVAVCTGSLLLGKAGLLKGYKAASHWAVIDTLEDPASQDTEDRPSLPADPITAQEIHWSAPIHFFPDGRAEQATLSIEGPDAVVIDITLRGLTGTATAGTPQRRPAPKPTASPAPLSPPTGP